MAKAPWDRQEAAAPWDKPTQDLAPWEKAKTEVEPPEVDAGFSANDLILAAASGIVGAGKSIADVFGADTEFFERSKLNCKIFYDDEICFLRRQHDNNQTRNSTTGLGTPARRKVQEILRQMKKENKL